jgi:hypothetical protein
MEYTSLLEYVNDHKDRTDTIHGWSVVKTKHGLEREHERHGGELPGGHHEFMHKVIKKISGVKNPRSGEFMYHSMKHNQAAVLNVDHEKKQLRVITVLPKGRTVPKAGTQKFMIEGVEQVIETFVLYDTEFDEAMDQFVTEELGVGLDEVLSEGEKLVSKRIPDGYKEGKWTWAVVQGDYVVDSGFKTKRDADFWIANHAKAQSHQIKEELGVGLDGVVKCSIKEYSLLESANLELEFISKYDKHDPAEVFRAVKSGLLVHTSNYKAVNIGAAEISKKHSNMSRQEFDKHVVSAVFPHIKKAHYPNPNSKEFHSAIQDAAEEIFSKNSHSR